MEQTSLNSIIDKEIEVRFIDIEAKPLEKADIEAGILTDILGDKIGDVFGKFNCGEISGFIIGFCGVAASLWGDKLSILWKILVAAICLIIGVLFILIPHLIRKNKNTVDALVDGIKDEISFYQENHVRIGKAIEDRDNKMDDLIDDLNDACRRTKKKKKKIHKRGKKHNH